MKSISTWLSFGLAVTAITAAPAIGHAQSGAVPGIGHGRIDLRADFEDDDGDRTVIYRERVRDGDLDRRFILRVRDLDPGENVVLLVDEQITAAATADANGTALLRTRTPAFIEDPADWFPMPLTFPRIHYGDAIRIGKSRGAMVLDGIELYDGSVDLRARLFGAGTATGRVTYRERVTDEGLLDRRFIARVNGATPGELIRIYLDDGALMLGAVADETGTAVLRARTADLIDDPDDWDVLPFTFPRLLPGDEVVAGGRSGYFFSEDDDLQARSQRVRLDAIFGVPGFLVGDATYSERMRRGNLERVFTVFVENGEAGDVLTVRINTLPVASVPIDFFGEGRLTLRTGNFIDGPGDGDPMPATFPSILDGWVITVDVQSGPFFR